MDHLQQRPPVDPLEDFFLVPRPFYFDEEFGNLSNILEAKHLDQYSQHPRLYFILKESGKLSLFTHFTSKKVGDSSLPLPLHELNKVLEATAEVKDDQRDVVSNTILRHQYRAIKHEQVVYQRLLDEYFEVNGRAEFLDGSDFEEIARLLRFCGSSVERGTTSPKLYYLLRSIGLEELFDTFLRHGYSDVWIPFRRGDIKSHILPHESSLERLLEAQKVVYSPGWSEKTHLNFAEEPKALRSLKELGSGGVGRVDHVYCRSHRQHYARKSIYRSPETLRVFSNEIRILKSISHEHCITLAASYTDNATLAVLSVPVADMDLATMIGTTSSPLPLAEDRRNFLQASFGCLAVAISYLHRKGILHKDIKPQNILIHSNRLLITDFGLSAEITSASTTLGYTPKYDAPEMAEGGKHKESSDIWSLGCVFLEMLAKILYLNPSDFVEHWKAYGLHRVFYNTNNEATQSFIAKRLSGGGDRPGLEPMAEIARSLLPKMLDQSATARPSASQIVSSLAQGYDTSNKYGRCCQGEYVAMMRSVEEAKKEQKQQFLSKLEPIPSPVPQIEPDAQGRASEHTITRDDQDAIATGSGLNVLDDNTMTSARHKSQQGQAHKSLVVQEHQDTVLAHKGVHPQDSPVVASKPDRKPAELWDLEVETPYYTLGTHSRAIKTILFSPNRKMIFSGSADYTAKLWNVATGKLHKTIEGYYGFPGSTNFSPDSKLIAFVSLSNTIELWDTAAGKLYKTLGRHSSLVRTLAFSPDGKLVATGSRDRTAALWDVATGELQRLHSGLNHVEKIVYSPDGRFLALTSSDDALSLWNVRTGKLNRVWGGHKSTVKALAFSPNSEVVASLSENGIIKLWMVSTGNCLKTLNGQQIGSKFNHRNIIAFSPDGKFLACDSLTHLVDLWDVSTGKLQRTLGTPETQNLRSEVIFSPDGKFVALRIGDCMVKLWNLLTGQLWRTLKINVGEVDSGTTTNVVFSPDSELVAVGARGSLARPDNRLYTVYYAVHRLEETASV